MADTRAEDSSEARGEGVVHVGGTPSRGWHSRECAPRGPGSSIAVTTNEHRVMRRRVEAFL